MSLRKLAQKMICFGMIFILTATYIAVTPRNVKADVTLPFTYEGISYQDIKSTPEDTEDQVVLKTLNADASWIPGTTQNVNRHWMGIARTAYASKYGAEGESRYLDIDSARMTLPLFHSEKLFNYTRAAASANNTAGYEIGPDDDGSTGPIAEALYASNAKSALNGMMDGIMNSARKIGETESEQKDLVPMSNYVQAPEGLEDTLSQISGPAAYSWFGNFIQEGTEKYYDCNYGAIGIIYSNFKLTPVLPDDIGIKVKGADPQTGKNHEETGVFNATGSDVDVSQSLEESHSDTARNSISKTKTLSFSEGLSISHTASVGLSIGDILNASAETTTTASFSAEQVLETAWSSESEISDSKSTTRTVGLKLPPYTKVNLKQEKTSWDTTVTYDCPVYVTYDVTCVVFCRDPGSNSYNAPKSGVVCTLKNDATKDFLKRFVLTGSGSDPDLINWSVGLKNLYRVDCSMDLRYTLIDVNNYNAYSVNTDFTSAIKKNTLIYKRFSQYRPCILSGGTLNYTRQGTAYTIDGILPYYPLTKIKTGETKAYTMQAEEELHVDEIPLFGYNAYDGDFYGFQGQKGSWKMLDGDGNETSENDVAKLKEDKVSGYHYLEGKDEGRVYLRYYPDKSKYASGMIGDSAFVTIPVTVKAKPEAVKKYSIHTSGALQVYVDETTDLNTANGMKAYVEDENEYILSHILDWEAKDQSSSANISIQNGQMKISKAGTYHIRPTYTIGTKKIIADDWITVVAKEPGKLNKIGFWNQESKEGKLTDTRTYLTYDLASMLTYQDQNNDTWSGVTPPVTFSLDQNPKGAKIDSKGILQVTEAGEYTVLASAPGYSIAPVTLKVTDVRTKSSEVIGMTPEKETFEASGGKVTFQLVGKNLKDGIQVRSGKLRGWSTGNSTVQKVTIKFPVNKNKNKAQAYQMQYSFDGKTFYNSKAKIWVRSVKQGKIRKLQKKSWNKIYVKWNQDTKASGYQIQTAWNKKFTKGLSKTWVNQYWKTSMNLRKRSGKTYYVRVRNFKKAGRDRIYGNWSSVKKIKM